MKTIRLGIIGVSPGNGHPFSFAAIINGYSKAAMARAGWPVIAQYLSQRQPRDFGFPGVRITHVWTQDAAVTRRLQSACLIPNALHRYEEMMGEVDGVILARDDYEQHYRMALPFLKKGLFVFVDKPLSLRPTELRILKPYLLRGKLMSCSALRYAKEVEKARQELGRYGDLRLIRATVMNSWEKYGIHLLEAAVALGNFHPLSVTALEGKHASFSVMMKEGVALQIDALGESPKIFRLEVFGRRRISSFELTDNFSMFRRALGEFVRMVRSGKAVIPALETLDLMRTLIAGQKSIQQKRTVNIHEIKL